MPELFERLRTRLELPLPGKSAQYLMAPASRRIDHTPNPDARKAAVMLLLHRIGNSEHIILIERALHPHDKHSGQISFPGGSYQEDDEGLEQTALRETEEEIGVPRQAVQLLGALTELYIPVSNFLVQPYVGVLDYDGPMLPQKGEVQQIMKPKLDFFLDDTSKTSENIPIGNGIMLKDVPAYVFDGKVIWGATAMMLSELMTLVRDPNADETG